METIDEKEKKEKIFKLPPTIEKICWFLIGVDITLFTRLVLLYLGVL